MNTYQKRVWKCMDTLKTTMPEQEFEFFEELMYKEHCSGSSLHEVEELVKSIKKLSDYARLPWWKRVMGWSFHG